MIIGISIACAIVLLLIIYFMCGYVKAPTDCAYIITGLRKQPRILIGKAGFRFLFFERVDKISLSLISIDIKTKNAVPTSEFININVDAVANIKVSSDPELLKRAAESLLNKSNEEIIEQVVQVLEGNIREIVGASHIRDMVQDRKGIAEKVIANVVPDMQKIGMEVVNFNIQNFTDDANVIVNLGIDNVAQISKDAAIARANADRDIAIAQAAAREASNKSKIDADLKIIQQNTDFSLKQSELKKRSDSAQADADAAYSIQQQKRQEEINVAATNAEIAKRTREAELAEKEVALTERKLEAEVNKQADAKKYAMEKTAEAEFIQKQKAADAQKYELERQAEIDKIQAEAEKVVKEKQADALKIQAKAESDAIIMKAEAAKQAALAEAAGIEAKGLAEAEAINKKAEAMKKYGEAATLQLLLDSNVLPEIVKAYSEPMAAAMSNIGNITMYGEGNQAKLVEEIGKNGSQIVKGLKDSLGIDLPSVLAGFFGGKLLNTKPTETKDKE